MTIQQRKSHFIRLGRFLSQYQQEGVQKLENIPHNEVFFDRLQEQINMAVHYNGWFSKENVLFALGEWSKALTAENLDQWLKPYDFRKENSRTVGIVMAGNIPLVGFHDFISVLISGHNVLVKQSSNDKILLPILAEYLIALEPAYKEKIEFTEGRMYNFDAVIATGSNNTARYFEYYFADKPSIIRKNRNSVAVLSGRETENELQALSNDIFRYFGLGCRNVSKIYVPEGYNFDSFFRAMFPWNHLINHAKYANNYDYNKAVYLMSEFKLLDNGFLLLKQDENFGSPIATVFYETYSQEEQLKGKLLENRENIQCVVSKGLLKEEVPFGQSQHPKLWDFADNIDTLAFLEKL